MMYTSLVSLYNGQSKSLTQCSSDGESIGASFCSTHRFSGGLQVHVLMQLSSTPITYWKKLNKIIEIISLYNGVKDNLTYLITTVN